MTEQDERTVSTREMLDRTGVSYRVLDWWCGHLELIPKGSPGSGRSRMYTERDVRVVTAAVAMRDAGLRASVAVETARRLVDEGGTVSLADGLLWAKLPKKPKITRDGA